MEYFCLMDQVTFTRKKCRKLLTAIFELKIPVFGICIAHQLIGLSFGAKTSKMSQGHRGANHPVKNLSNKKVEITSQNHGYQIDLILTKLLGSIAHFFI